MVHTFNPSTLEAEAGGISEFEVSVVYRTLGVGVGRRGGGRGGGGRGGYRSIRMLLEFAHHPSSFHSGLASPPCRVPTSVPVPLKQAGHVLIYKGSFLSVFVSEEQARVTEGKSGSSQEGTPM